MELIKHIFDFLLEELLVLGEFLGEAGGVCVIVVGVVGADDCPDDFLLFGDDCPIQHWVVDEDLAEIGEAMPFVS